MVRCWAALCLSRLVHGNPSAAAAALDEHLVPRLAALLLDPAVEVRAAAVHALGALVGALGVDGDEGMPAPLRLNGGGGGGGGGGGTSTHLVPGGSLLASIPSGTTCTSLGVMGFSFSIPESAATAATLTLTEPRLPLTPSLLGGRGGLVGERGAMADDGSFGGWLFKRGAVRKDFRRRWMVAAGGRLSWHVSAHEQGAAAPPPQGEPEPGLDAAPPPKADLVSRPRGGGGSVLLRGAVVQAISGGGGGSGRAHYRLTITPSAQSMHRGRVFVFEAAGEVERAEWVEVLRSHAQGSEHHLYRSELRPPAADQHPADGQCVRFLAPDGSRCHLQVCAGG